MDEPLANLDYKLRGEVPKLFNGRRAIVFYATTELHEALLFGGKTATLHEGRIIQYGPTSKIYREPDSLLPAEVFSDPPLNITRVTIAFFLYVFGSIAVMGIWEYYSPGGNPRRGVFTLDTT